MISRVFGKTKPINYLVVFGFLLFCTSLAFIRQVDFGSSAPSIYLVFLTFLGVLGAAAAGNNLALANQLIGPHLYIVYLFSLLILLFPSVILDHNSALANLFILGAAFRLNQIRPFKNIQGYVFDASLMIFVASLFLEWSVLFVLFVWAHVYVFGPLNPRNWLVPIAAFIVFLLILTAILLVTGNIQFFEQHYSFSANLGALSVTGKTYTRLMGLTALVFLVFLGFRRQKSLLFGKALQMQLNGIMFLIALGVIVLELSSGNEATILSFFPAALFLSKQVESFTKSRFRELALLGGLLLSFGVFIIGWIQQ